MLDDLGILATLSWFCRTFGTTYPGIRIEQKIGIQEKEVPDSLKTSIFRITQEAMNNIVKHGKATFVILSLRGGGKKIELAIQDNGVGFNAEETLGKSRSQRGLPPSFPPESSQRHLPPQPELPAGSHHGHTLRLLIWLLLKHESQIKKRTTVRFSMIFWAPLVIMGGAEVNEREGREQARAE